MLSLIVQMVDFGPPAEIDTLYELHYNRKYNLKPRSQILTLAFPPIRRLIRSLRLSKGKEGRIHE